MLKIVRFIFLSANKLIVFPCFQDLIASTNKVQFELVTIHYFLLSAVNIKVDMSDCIDSYRNSEFVLRQSRSIYVSQLILSCINISLVILKEIGRSRNGRVAFDFVSKSVNL